MHARLKPTNSPPQAGRDTAQIASTVPTNSCRGQVRKHYIWCGHRHIPSILHTQCGRCARNRGEGREGRENRESGITLAQAGRRGNEEVRGQLSGASLRSVRGRGARPSHRTEGTADVAVPMCFCLRSATYCLRPISPISQRTSRSTQSRDGSSGCGTSRWGRAGCRRGGRSPS
jgi:hypothetical protein